MRRYLTAGFLFALSAFGFWIGAAPPARQPPPPAGVPLGALGDGASHPASTRFATLAECQAVYPRATALTDELARLEIQRLIDAASVTTPLHGGKVGKAVTVPAGRYRIDFTLRVGPVHGLSVRGDGPTATTLLWHGPAGGDVFHLDDTDSVGLADFRVMCPVKAGCVVRIVNGTADPADPADPHLGSPWVPTSCRFSRLVLGGFSTGQFDYGVRVGPFGQNNEYHTFEDCLFAGFTEAGAWVRVGQAHGLNFHRCTFLGYGQGKHCLDCEYGSYVRVEKCSCSGIAVSDINLREFFAGPCAVLNFNSELGRRLLTAGGGGTTCPITVAGCRFETDRLHEDGHALAVGNNGPLVLSNNYIYASNTNPYCFVDSLQGAGPLAVEHRGNKWVGPADYPPAGAVRTHPNPAPGHLLLSESSNQYLRVGDNKSRVLGSPGDFARLDTANAFLQAQAFAGGLSAKLDHFALHNAADPAKGLAFETVHGDGRSRVRAKNTATGVVFWDHAGSPIQFERGVLFDSWTAMPDPFFGASNTSGGQNGIKLRRSQPAGGGTVTLYATSVAAPPESQPALELAGKALEVRVGTGAAADGGTAHFGADPGGLWFRAGDGRRFYLDCGPGGEPLLRPKP